MQNKCIILGGGGHARVLIDCLNSSGIGKIYGILDRDERSWKSMLMDIPILGGDNLLPQLVTNGVNCFAIGLGSTQDNHSRQRLFELGLCHQLKPLTIIHPKSICSPWAKIGEGAQLLPGSIVNAGVELGLNVIINSGSIVEHDCTIGDHAHIATGAKLCGTVKIGNRVHIGTGAIIRQSIFIGEDAIIGAGAVVVKDVSAHTVVVGNPAKPLER
jgi:sugar O-acyltransferase (sialic acid O-acetyltransferase NeuD family)